VVWHTTLPRLVSIPLHPLLVYHLRGCLARLLSFFGQPSLQPVRLCHSCTYTAHWRFLYFHGQRHARLVRDQTVYSKPRRERSILITLLSPLLFLAPEVHLREVERLWTDEVIIETVWKTFMIKLLAEWEDIILWVRCLVIFEWPHFSSHVTSTLVSRHAHGQCELSCYPGRSPIQSQRE
jgi:hypothetical protein